MTTLPRLRALLLGLPLLTGCGSGTAALFSSADEDDTPEPFELQLANGSPVLYPSLQAARAVDPADRAPSTGFLTLVLSESPDPDTLRPQDFRITLLGANGQSDSAPEIPRAISLQNGLLVLELNDELTLNGNYLLRIATDAALRSVSGQALSGPTFGYLSVYPGAYGEAQVVSSGGASASSINIGEAGNAYVRLEAVLVTDSGSGATYALGATSALSNETWDVPTILYQTAGASGANLPFTTLDVTGDTALLGIKEGNLVASLQSQGYSITLRGIPGHLLAPNTANALVSWPPFQLGGQANPAYRLDQGIAELDNGQHISWPMQAESIPANQLSSSAAYGRNLSVWWGWTEPTGSSSSGTFLRYGVYANSMSADPVLGTQWPAARRLTDPGDDNAGWPLLARFPSGKVAVLWNDAPPGDQSGDPAGILGSYRADIGTYKAALYDPSVDEQGTSDPWSSASAYDASSAPGRLIAVEPYREDEVLAFVRLDRDGVSVPGSVESERAEIGVRRLAFDATGNLIDSPSSPVTGAVTPSNPPADFYPISLGYEGAFNLTGDNVGLPKPEFYNLLRRTINRAEIEVQPIDGARFLVSWRGATFLDGVPQLYLSIFNAEDMVWENGGEVFEFGSQLLDLGSAGSEIFIVGTRVDRLGYATVVWSEVIPDPNPDDGVDPITNRVTPDVVRAFRTGQSILDPNIALSEAFSTESGSITTIADYEPIGADPLSFAGIYPAGPSISETDESGHFLILWSRRLYDGLNIRAIGANARRFR